MPNEDHIETQIPQKSSSEREKLSLDKIETRVALEHLRGLRNGASSYDRRAQIIQEKIKQELVSEKQGLEQIAEENTDPVLLAWIETREKEIEKELVDIEIEWLEKQMWDLHVDTSPEKTKIAEKIEWIKRGELRQSITDCVGALRGEKLLLSEVPLTLENSKRIESLDDQIKKLETEWGSLEKLRE